MNLELDLQQACKAEIPKQSLFKQWIKAVLIEANYSKDVIITVRLVDRQESQQLNAEYRDKDKPTNILSFPFEPPPGIEAKEIDQYLGDLVICADIVEQEAQQQSKSLESHWAHMSIHGVLHLLGFDHIEAEDAEKMESIEIDLLLSLGYANPY